MISEGGKINMIIGPMFSGKSTKLVEVVRKYTYSNKKTALVNFSGDKRYSDKGSIVTHERQEYAAITCDRLEQKMEELKKADVIGIDEGQFFSDLVEQCDLLCSMGKIVIVSALSGDFKMEPFDNVAKLIAKADKVKLLKAFCHYCHKNAGFTLRTIKTDQVIFIGASEAYQPVCKNCHITYTHQKQNETISITKTVLP